MSFCSVLSLASFMIPACFDARTVSMYTVHDVVTDDNVNDYPNELLKLWVLMIKRCNDMPYLALGMDASLWSFSIRLGL